MGQSCGEGAACRAVRVLGVTTSSPRGGAALVEGGAVLARVAYVDELRHAERFFETLDAVLGEAGLGRADIDALACDLGPGSFTGIRVGLASAKGVALALGVPLVGVSSLQAIAEAAFGAAGGQAPVATLLDAKRGETFLAVYGAGGVIQVPPRHVRNEDVAELLSSLDPLTRVVGTGVPESLEARRIRTPGGDLPDPEQIALEGERQLSRGPAPSLTELEPIYLRAPDARPTVG